MTAPWFDIALADMATGIHEIPGQRSNPTILRWVRELGVEDLIPNDDRAWCALAVSHWLQQDLLARGLNWREHLPRGAGLVRARAYEQWGSAVPFDRLGDPAVRGSIIVLERKLPDRRTGRHVGLLNGLEEQAGPGWIRVLGGNQRNGLRVSLFERDRLRALRWPSWAQPV